MYMKRMLEIGQASNGYVVECRVPIKRKEKGSSDRVVSEYPGSCEKQYVAKDMNEVSEIVKKVMPLLDTSFSTEEEFDKAFNKAAGVMDEED